MGPISSLISMPEWLDMLIALLIGVGFGFSLEQAGFSSSRKLAGMFYGYDTTVIKGFFYCRNCCTDRFPAVKLPGTAQS